MTALADAVALLVFVTTGALTHGASFAAFVRDLALFEAAWFALRRLPLPARWPVAITAAVAVRAALVGHLSFAFWLVALALGGGFVLTGRLLVGRFVPPGR